MDFTDIWGRPCSPSTILRWAHFLLTDTAFFYIYLLLRQVEHYEFIFNLQFSLLLKKNISITSNFKSVSFFSSFFTLYIYSQISTCRQVGTNTTSQIGSKLHYSYLKNLYNILPLPPYHCLFAPILIVMRIDRKRTAKHKHIHSPNPFVFIVTFVIIPIKKKHSPNNTNTRSIGGTRTLKRPLIQKDKKSKGDIIIGNGNEHSRAKAKIKFRIAPGNK